MDITISGQPLLAYLLAAIRIAAWLVVVPPFSSRAFPTAAKALLALGLAFAVAPAMNDVRVPGGTVELLGLALVQALIGASMGFVTYLVFAAIQAAGDLVDVFGGFSLAAAFDPMSFTHNSVFGKLHQMLATMLLFASGAHLLVIGGLLRTFDDLPVDAVPDALNLTNVVTTGFGVFFTSAVQIALPLVGVLFIADLGLALLTRVAPQLNAIGIMFPAKIGLTLIVVGLSFPILPDAVSRLVDMAIDAMDAMAVTP
ncbi:MAG TPA: flagellar biosynthetic protein FliR, partial [Nocardioidaceae bacterium]|nr:flagellar biosynthetic protein FliR [Nocardioidaceae bacterium]